MFKKSFFAVALLVASTTAVYAQANTNLSNLVAPTSINESLTPNSNGLLDLGTTAQSWQYLFLDSGVYIKDQLAMHAPGIENFFVGRNAGTHFVSGRHNTGIGNMSLASAAQATGNTAVGYGTMQNTYFGGGNVAVGFESLNMLSTGGGNTAVGFRTLRNSNGSHNTAVGHEALLANLTGSGITAIGYRALYSNTSGAGNTATGRESLVNNIGGHYNTANGYQALLLSVSSSYNTATGYMALTSSTGSSNTSNGSIALYSNTSGTYNTALGASALYSNTTGNFNTALGCYAGGSAATLSNSTAIGYNSIFTASNQIMLGNSTVNSVKACANYTIISDGRFKKDIQENVPGLEFIKQLRPVTYHYNIRGMNEKTATARSSDDQSSAAEKMALQQIENDAIDGKEKIVYTGFVAQEVEKAASKLNYDFSGVYKPQNDKDLYGLSYSDFVVPLVKAVQELSAKNDKLQQEVEELKAILKAQLCNNTKLPAVEAEKNVSNPVNVNTAAAEKLPSK